MDLPLGDGTIGVDLDHVEPTVVHPAGGEPVDVRTATRTALDDPHGGDLASRVAPDATVAVVVTDGTRAVPTDVLLDELLADLRDSGVHRSAVTVVVGLTRPPSSPWTRRRPRSR